MNKQEYEHLRTQLIDHHVKCIGNDYTADPIFIVKSRQVSYGYEEEYAEVTHLYHDCTCYESVDEYLENYDDDDLSELFEGVEYFSPSKLRKMEIKRFADYIEEHNIIEWQDMYLVYGNYIWKTHRTFLTREAAEGYVERRCGGKDNPNVNIWVESLYYDYELKSLLKAVINGDLVWKE